MIRIFKRNTNIQKKTGGKEKPAKVIIAEVIAMTGLAFLTYGVNNYAVNANNMLQATGNGGIMAAETMAGRGIVDAEADPEADEYVTGAGVELIIGSTDSMTREDFEDMMENLTIVEEEEEEYN